jgi:nicotinamidase/pyrazinamidase
MLPQGAVVISKATDPKQDAYSGFQGTDLAQRLKAQGIRQIWVGGLATDYCVKSTVLDGLKAGFRVYFLSDASRAVNVHPGDEQKSIQEMLTAGAHSLTFNQFSLESS